MPVITSKHQNQSIDKVLIDYKRDWISKHLKTLKTNYSKAKYFNYYINKIESIYKRNHELLVDINIDLIGFIIEILNINTKILRSSDLNIDHNLTKNDLLIQLCKKVNAETYLSGKGAQKYNDPELFKKNNIHLLYQEFIHPEYKQQYGNFIYNLSILDLLFNYGPESLDIINSSL